jgi:hypothetical protein
LQRHTHPEKIFQIPEKILPIAEGAGEAYLYLDLRVEGKNPVLALISGLPQWTGLHQENTVIKLADSFSDYLNALEFDADFYKSHLATMIARQETKYILATIDYLEFALPNWRELYRIDYDDGRPIQLKLWDND